jgi:hypothetical protein
MPFEEVGQRLTLPKSAFQAGGRARFCENLGVSESRSTRPAGAGSCCRRPQTAAISRINSGIADCRDHLGCRCQAYCQTLHAAPAPSVAYLMPEFAIRLRPLSAFRLPPPIEPEKVDQHQRSRRRCMNQVVDLLAFGDVAALACASSSRFCVGSSDFRRLRCRSAIAAPLSFVSGMSGVRSGA